MRLPLLGIGLLVPMAMAHASSELVVRLDVRNLVKETAELTETRAQELAQNASRIWSQCGIRFSPRSTKRIELSGHGLPFPPKSVDELSQLADAVHPKFFDGAIPLTYAGPWTFFDPGSRLHLQGLGWAFVRSGRIDRVGAMISTLKLSEPGSEKLIAHELGHALSLGHSSFADNVMAGGDRLLPEQCAQAREFARAYLQ